MPLIETHTTAQSVVITIWHRTETITELLSLWGDKPLPENMVTAKAEKRQCEILSTLLLLRHYFGSDIELHHTPQGAPYIDGYHISISHCDTHVAIALHPTQRVGLDIEILGKRADRVATRFLSPDEWNALPDETVTPIEGISARTIATHMAWSVKEATYKVYPTAVEFRQEIILSPFSTLPSGTVYVNLPTQEIITEAHYTLYNGCSLAWVVE